MIQSVLDKRPYDERLFDIDCSDLLAEEEVITEVTEIVCEIPASAAAEEQPDPPVEPPVDVNAEGFTFGEPVINAGPLLYPRYNHRAEPGKVIQVMIGGGVLVDDSTVLLCTVRARFETNMSPQMEATVVLRLIASAP